MASQSPVFHRIKKLFESMDFLTAKICENKNVQGFGTFLATQASILERKFESAAVVCNNKMSLMKERQISHFNIISQNQCNENNTMQ
jgi:hypothetical protein